MLFSDPNLLDSEKTVSDDDKTKHNEFQPDEVEKVRISNHFLCF